MCFRAVLTVTARTQPAHVFYEVFRSASIGYFWNVPVRPFIPASRNYSLVIVTPSHHPGPLPGVSSPRRLRFSTSALPCSDSDARTRRVSSPLSPRGLFHPYDESSLNSEPCVPSLLSEACWPAAAAGHAVRSR